MKYVYIYCEGQTEEGFINNVLMPYFAQMGIYVTPIIHKTKRTATMSYRGGVSKYSDIKKEIDMLCQNPNIIVTTMFDYYQMPTDTPEINCNESDIYKRMEIIEDAINQDIGRSNLMFNLMLHEFETLLFSEPQSFKLIARDNIVNAIQKIRDEFPTPEHINNSLETAPSKRILHLIPNYSKTRQGVLIAKDIGITQMLAECKHFAAWIEKIKNACV